MKIPTLQKRFKALEDRRLNFDLSFSGAPTQENPDGSARYDLLKLVTEILGESKNFCDGGKLYPPLHQDPTLCRRLGGGLTVAESISAFSI